MNSKLWIRKGLTMSLTVAVLATYSMAALAGDGKAAGEIVITGNPGSAAVTVNGEPAKSGRTIFSSSTISTPEGAGAIVNLGKAGKIELAPKTTFLVSFDDKSISGDLAEGSVSVLNALQAVSVKTLSGEPVGLNVGESATATSGTASKRAAAASNGSIWPFVLVLGGAIGLIAVFLAADNDVDLGGSAITISPIR
jgi:hypothetical protein